MGKVSGYRTRSGKRVRSYVRGGDSLGFLRHSRPKKMTAARYRKGRQQIESGRYFADLYANRPDRYIRRRSMMTKSDRAMMARALSRGRVKLPSTFVKPPR
jgi:hypothetical protein